MDPEDVLAAVLYGLLIAAILLVFAAIARVRAARSRRLQDEAQRTLDDGDPEGALDRLKQALWTARQSPDLERRILADLARLYRDAKLPGGPAARVLADYDALIEQVVELARRDTHKAFAEIKKVQAVKRALLGRLPPV